MNNHQKGSALNAFLVIVIIILAGALVYFHVIEKPTMTTQPQTTDVSDTQPTPITVTPINTPLPQTVPTTASTSSATNTGSAPQEQWINPPAGSTVSAGWYTYLNPQYMFQMQLYGASPVIGTEGDGSIFVDYEGQNGVGDLKYFKGVMIYKEACSAVNLGGPTQSIPNQTINGITYTQYNGQGYSGGMTEGSFDVYYCTPNNGSSYIVVFSEPYLDSQPVSSAAAYAEFAKEMKFLNFQFTH